MTSVSVLDWKIDPWPTSSSWSSLAFTRFPLWQMAIWPCAQSMRNGWALATRLSTAGESRVANAQPFLIDCAHGQIAICHNGNLVNASELHDELVGQGSIFQSSTDTEVIVHLYARSKAVSVED